MLTFSDSYACAIPDKDNDEMILTGGRLNLTEVSVYSKSGHLRDLADLKTGRYSHACSSFILDNKMVDVSR